MTDREPPPGRGPDPARPDDPARPGDPDRSAAPAGGAASLWGELAARVRDRGTRVDERLALLAALRDPAGAGGDLERCRRRLLDAVREAAADLEREAQR